MRQSPIWGYLFLPSITIFAQIMKKAILILVLLLLTAYTTVQAQYADHRNRKVDSLEMVLNGPNPPDGEQLIRVYTDLMYGYIQTDGEKSDAYAQKALELSYEINALNARFQALRILGQNAYGRDDFDQAIAFYNEAADVIEQMKGDKRYNERAIDDNLSSLYGSIANVYNMQDKVHLAIHYYQLALPIFEKYQWMESATILYHNIGELYFNLGNVAEAERNFLKAVETSLQTNDSLIMVLPHKGLAKLYQEEGDYEKAERSAKICWDYFSCHADGEADDYLSVLVVMARIQLIHYHDIEKAEALVNEALSRMNEENSSEEVGDVYNACCEIAMERKQWKKAEDYAWKAINAGESDSNGDIGSYYYLTQIYAEMGEPELVKECAGKVYDGLLQLATGQYQSSLSQMEVVYETEKKQAAIEQLKAEKRWYTTGSLLVGCILLLLILLFFMLWRSVRQSKRNAVVKAKLDGELSERVRIARDLHDRLGGLLTGVKMRLAPESEEAKLTDEAIREMRNVSHHLLPDSLQRFGLCAALRDYCQTMRKVTFSFYGDEKRIEHEEVIYCIVHELVNNAVKNADADHIQVQLMVGDDTTTINVSDDGNGNLELSTSEGSGMRNIRERVEAIGGRMDVYSKPGEGSEINIEFKNNPKDDRSTDR